MTSPLSSSRSGPKPPLSIKALPRFSITLAEGVVGPQAISQKRFVAALAAAYASKFRQSLLKGFAAASTVAVAEVLEQPDDFDGPALAVDLKTRSGMPGDE